MKVINFVLCYTDTLSQFKTYVLGNVIHFSSMKLRVSQSQPLNSSLHKPWNGLVIESFTSNFVNNLSITPVYSCRNFVSLQNINDLHVSLVSKTVFAKVITNFGKKLHLQTEKKENKKFSYFSVRFFLLVVYLSYKS